MSDIATLIKNLNDRMPGYELARRYYDGRHRCIVATDQYSSTFATYLEAFRYNRCQTIIDAHTDRLKIVAFTDQGSRKEIADRAAEVWGRNRMDRKQLEIETEALVLGAAFAIVWPDDDGFPRIYPQSGDRMMVLWDDQDPGRIAVAAKLWRPRQTGTEKPKWHLNLYYPDRLEKYVQRQTDDLWSDRAEGWEQRLDEEDAGAWPVRYPWGEGIPVFPFLNRARTGGWGVSELRPLIPLQDLLNKSLLDMAVAAEYMSFPQRWSIGVEPEYDEQSGVFKSPFKNGPGQLWMAPGDAGGTTPSFGQFAPGDVAQYTDAQEHLDTQMARLSAVPSHYLGMSGDFPSGESLKTAEAPFTRKIEKIQTSRGNDWEDLMHFCLGLLGVALEDVELQAVWEPAEPRSDVDFWNTATLKLNAGVPEDQIWREAGYTEEQIKAWQALLEEKRRQAEQQAEAIRRAMNDQDPDEGSGDVRGRPGQSAA